MRLGEKVLNKLKSIYVNNKVFPKKIARKQPIYISYKVKCSGLYKGAIEIHSSNVYAGMIQIANKTSAGIHGSEVSYLNFIEDGKLIFKGKADLCKGISINIYPKARLTIGDNLFCNGACTIRCMEQITVGDDNMWGWNVHLMDSDGHPIYDHYNRITNYNRPIEIGDHVWLGSNTQILKGTIVRNGCIVGFGSLVSGKNEHENSILVGTPAKEIKQDIRWERDSI